MVSLIFLLGILAGSPVAGKAGPADGTPRIPPRCEAQWLTPAEGSVWQHGGLLSLLLFPMDADPDSLRVAIDGRDLTARFLPVSHLKKNWRYVIDRDVIASEGLCPEGKAGERRFGGAGPGTRRLFRRVSAMLDEADLRPGSNRLVASYRRKDGRPRRVERAFRFEPAGRRIDVRIHRDRGGRKDTGATARVVVLPLAGAPPPDFSFWVNPALTAARDHEPMSFVLARGGEAVMRLPEGRYRLLATGGPLDSVEAWDVPEKGNATHTFVLRREVDLPGTLTADFHVHGAPSNDSLVPLDERVWSLLAGGLDAFVAADHGNITDYRPVVARMEGAQDRLLAIPGVEAGYLTGERGFSVGHWNFWPLEPEGDPFADHRSGHGALLFMTPEGDEGIRGDVIAGMYETYRVRARQLARQKGLEALADRPIVVQLNHPRGYHREDITRLLRGHDFFNAIGFRPDRPLTGKDASKSPNARLLARSPSGHSALDFDALEIWNRNSRTLYREVRRDWFGLLNQGYAPTGVANTDTHTIDPELAGYPMNVVFPVPGGSVDGSLDLVEAVRAGRVVGTDGPVPLLTVSTGEQSARPGDLLPASGGSVSVIVKVRAASWVPVGTVRVWVNGAVAAEQRPASDGSRPSMLTTTLPLERDAWILAEVGDPEAPEEGRSHPGLYGVVAPRGLALGFTNPVLVDTDGNGRFDPPGLAQGQLPPP